MKSNQIQAMRPEAFLVWNLTNPEYLNLVLDGKLANLPSAIATHWDLARAIRKERLQVTTDHPMPTTKKQLRNPTLLDRLKQTIATIVETTTKKTVAA